MKKDKADIIGEIIGKMILRSAGGISFACWQHSVAAGIFIVALFICIDGDF